MSGASWGKFFWSDWRSDPALRVCSLAARGLWIDMLAIMAEADGYLLISDKPCTPTVLARIVGAELGAVESALDELEEQRVFSRDRRGVIYSRRMVRDAKTRSKSRENGKMGGNPSLRKDTGNSQGVNPLPGNPEARVQNPEARESENVVIFPPAQQAAPPSDWPAGDARDLLDQLAAAVGHPWLDPRKDVTASLHRSAPTYFARWLDAGCSWRADVLPQVTALCTTAGRPVQTLKFFDGAVMDARAARTSPHVPSPHGARHDDKLARREANLARSDAALERLAEFYGRVSGGGGSEFD